jgi:Xaa-Pro dipeptidase
MSTNEQKSMFQSRQSHLAVAIKTSGLNCLAVNPGPSLAYLTGLHFHLMERPVVALFIPHNPLAIVLPELESGKVKDLPFPVQIFPYGEDPETWTAAFKQAAHASGIGEGSRVGVEPRRLRVLELRLLENSVRGANFVSAEECMADLRVHKDASEIAATRKAVEAAQNALETTLPLIKIGMTEREIASELTLQLLRHGSEPEIPFSPIVASGPNSANPHSVPGNRRLAEGDLLIIDWGATVDGYVSDLTRTFAVGKIDPEFEHIANVVIEANQAGRSAAGPGVPAERVDQAARQVIENAGYGKYFTHRTGHGIGMEEHEEPYIREGNPKPLDPGMLFTVEPGIYIPGRAGVRVEDNVLITEDGTDTLSDIQRSLRVVG